MTRNGRRAGRCVMAARVRPSTWRSSVDARVIAGMTGRRKKAWLKPEYQGAAMHGPAGGGPRPHGRRKLHAGRLGGDQRADARVCGVEAAAEGGDRRDDQGAHDSRDQCVFQRGDAVPTLCKRPIQFANFVIVVLLPFVEAVLRAGLLTANTRVFAPNRLMDC